MASIYDLKPKFQGLLRPMVAALASGGVTANQVTVFAAIISVLWGIGMAMSPINSWLFWALGGLMLFRMALNAVDGMLAREFGQKSKLGAMLNELGDVVADLALYLPFMKMGGAALYIVPIVASFSIITEVTGLSTYLAGASRRYDGPMGKSDRAFWFSLLGR